MPLNTVQKREFIENGFLRIPGVVPRYMVNAALHAINASVGQGMNKDDMPKMRSQSFCPEIQGSPVIADLLNKTPAWELAESAIAPGKLKPVKSGQVALRFPAPLDPPPPPRPHLDGMYSPLNGVPEGTIQNFTMLAAVFLSDVPGDFCGNFTVWPGTHHLFEGYFREHGPESLLDGMPKVDLPPARQLTVEAGDFVMCHYQVAHAAAVNVSPHVRYAIFFRLTHVDHADQKWNVMTDIWKEWDGLREALEGE
ncbi:MAG: phytanoyl-CoA dioxygenase family protein [Armatimonadetes bacterium]|nr:phytanoyl-CoA dioxygenase family protein [Armatimonadota bacterium]